MTNIVNGCNFFISIPENTLTSRTYVYNLPNGYSINTIHIITASNIVYLNNVNMRNDLKLTFPVVNSKSPSSITLSIAELNKSTSPSFVIEKFGQIPDSHYFDKAFDPILVTGNDGNKYPVIPSDQFK